jgi:hypothetical protein
MSTNVESKNPPWGPLKLSNTDLVSHHLTIPGLTFQYITHNIVDVETYKEGMEILVGAMRGQTSDSTWPLPSHTGPYARMQKAVNKKLYGKTALQSLVAMELSLNMTSAKFPEVVFRTHLSRTMKGIEALHAVCGNWIDVSTDDDWGLNIAGNCTYFRANFYTKIISHDHLISYEAAPIGVWTGKRTGVTSPANTPLFDFIKLLWPDTSIYATADPVKMIKALDKMQFRANKLHVTNITGDIGSDSTKLEVEFMVETMKKLQTTDHFNSRTAFSKLSYIGTELLHGEQKVAVEQADAVIIPCLEMMLNAAQTRMSV